MVIYMTKTKRTETRTSIRIDADLQQAYKDLDFGERLDNDQELFDILNIAYYMFAMTGRPGFTRSDELGRPAVTVKAPKTLTLKLSGNDVSQLLRAYQALEIMNPSDLKRSRKGFDPIKMVKAAMDKVISGIINRKNAQDSKAVTRQANRTTSMSKTTQDSRQFTVNGKREENKNFLIWYAFDFLKTNYKGKKSDIYKRRTEILLEAQKTREQHPERVAELVELSKNYILDEANPVHAEAFVNIHKGRAWMVNILPEYVDRVADRGETLLALYILIPELLEKAKMAHGSEL